MLKKEMKIIFSYMHKDDDNKEDICYLDTGASNYMCGK